MLTKLGQLILCLLLFWWQLAMVVYFVSGIQNWIALQSGGSASFVLLGILSGYSYAFPSGAVAHHLYRDAPDLNARAAAKQMMIICFIYAFGLAAYAAISASRSFGHE
jgi:hypothetical protein